MWTIECIILEKEGSKNGPHLDAHGQKSVKIFKLFTRKAIWRKGRKNTFLLLNDNFGVDRDENLSPIPWRFYSDFNLNFHICSNADVWYFSQITRLLVRRLEQDTFVRVGFRFGCYLETHSKQRVLLLWSSTNNCSIFILKALIW